MSDDTKQPFASAEAERIGRGNGTLADAIALFDLLAADTRKAVSAYLAENKGRLGTIDPKIHGNPGWPTNQPSGAVLHVPAVWGRLALHSVDIARRFMVSSLSPKGTNIVVGWPDGRLLTPIHPKNRSWHAGRVNGTCVGVDVVSPGPLVPVGNDWCRWDGKNAPIVRPDGSPLQPEDILDLGEGQTAWGLRYWHCPTPEQVFGLALALRALRLYHPTIQAELVVRHADIDRVNRCDPGPGIPLEALRVWMLGDNDLVSLSEKFTCGGWQNWHAFLLEQWRAPSGIVTAFDLRCPGRPMQAEGVR